MLYKEDWPKVKETFGAWWEKSLDRPLIQIFSPKNDRWEKPIDIWVFHRHHPNVDEAINSLLSQFAKTSFLKEAYPNAWINLGPGILSAFLGADVKFNTNIDTAWFEGNMDLDNLRNVKFDQENIWWKYLVKCTKIASKKCYKKAVVGFTDLLDPITVVGQLRGKYPTNVLRDMFLNGYKLDKVVEGIQKIWFHCFEELCKFINVSENGYSTWAGLWSDKSHYILQCDTIVYLSPKLFDRFIYPYVGEQCKFFDRTIWHLDGPLELKHLDKLLDIPELDGIQWIPGAGNQDAGEDVWLPLYKKIQAKGKLLQLYVQPQRVMHILNKLSRKGVAVQTTCQSFEEAKSLLAQFELNYQ
jgi:hypothetical protein